MKKKFQKHRPSCAVPTIQTVEHTVVYTYRRSCIVGMNDDITNIKCFAVGTRRSRNRHGTRRSCTASHTMGCRKNSIGGYQGTTTNSSTDKFHKPRKFSRIGGRTSYDFLLGSISKGCNDFRVRGVGCCCCFNIFFLDASSK